MQNFWEQPKKFFISYLRKLIPDHLVKGLQFAMEYYTLHVLELLLHLKKKPLIILKIFVKGYSL